MMCLARRHNQFSEKILQDVISQPKVLVQNKATPEARKFHALYSQVRKSMCKDPELTRLNVSKHGILYAKVEPEHKTEDVILNRFMYRFPTFVILISSPRGTFIGRREEGISFTKDSLEKVLKHFESILPVDPMLDGLEEFDESIWADFYNSQYNPRLASKKRFTKLMPKKYHKLKVLKHELRAVHKNTSLSDF
jgi:hypothetical protein